MKHQWKLIVFGLCCYSFDASPIESKQFSLEEYLETVKANHGGFESSRKASGGGLLISKEASLLYSPKFFLNGLYSSDEKPTPNPGFQGTKTIFQSYSFGLDQLTPYGQSARLSYNLNYYSIKDTNPGFVVSPKYYDMKPMIEVTQSLWRNGFGSETRALHDATEAAALATHFSERYRMKSILADAEWTYWNLVFANEIVGIKQDSIERTKSLRSWSARRAKLNLADKSDLLQADAALKTKELELQTAFDGARTAALNFNSQRGIVSEKVPEALQAFNLKDWDYLNAEIYRAASPTAPRDDVRASEQVNIQARAQAQTGLDKNSPVLDAFGSYGWNGHDAHFDEARSDSFGDDFPAWTVGVRFSMPLFFGDLNRTRDGYRQQQLASDLRFQRNVTDQNTEWQDLTKRLGETKTRLELAIALEKVQREKVLHERKRLDSGRTTLYQVILFEQDYATSQVQRVQLEMELVQIAARLKLFGAEL